MTRLFSLLVVAALFGCENDALETRRTGNPNFDVGFLFEHEGCRVYRFYDSGLRYFVKCANGQAAALGSHSESCGKNCTKTVTEEIPTVVVKP